MADISTVDARGLFTRNVIDTYMQEISPTSFLRSFFPDSVSPTKLLSIEVVRMGEKIAVDVERGTEGNRNTFSKSTEKTFLPPLYEEYFDMTELDTYDALFNYPTISGAAYGRLVMDVARKTKALEDKIERAYELQASQVLTTGIVSLNAGINIDFKRKAASLVDPGAGNYFANNIDPFALFQAGGTFLRSVGRSSGYVINAILGETAMADLLLNTKFLARQNQFHMVLDVVAPPQRNSVGAVYHGRISAGPYSVDLWTYPQGYDNASGVFTPYIDPKKVIMLPQNPHFIAGFAAVPQLIDTGAQPFVGKYLVQEFVDTRKAHRIIDIKSAGVMIPTAVDEIYTFKAVA